MPRDRPAESLRTIQITRGFLDRNPTSVLYAAGGTKVLCAASLQAGVPLFLEGKGRGWATAEYDLLPGSTTPRHARERGGKISGRTQEIQRLVGRSLRGILELEALDGWTLTVDCDVLQADGGTRTASINGAFISLSLLVRQALGQGLIPRSPIREALGAVSVGIVDGKCLLDLDYGEDSTAGVDLNLVMTEGGRILEIQGTSESRPFSFEELEAMVGMAMRGIREIIRVGREALGGGSR